MRSLPDEADSTSTSPFLPEKATPVPIPYQPNSGFNSTMAITIVVLLAALFFLVCFSLYIRRIAEQNSFHLSARWRTPVSLQPREPQGLDPTLVHALPFYVYGSCGETRPERIACTVCLSEFKEKEIVKVLPLCRHYFHKQCIDVWLSSHGSCPLCRSAVLVPRFRLPEVCLDVMEGQGRQESPENEETAAERCDSPASVGEGLVLLGLRKSWSCMLGGGGGEGNGSELRVSLKRSCSF